MSDARGVWRKSKEVKGNPISLPTLAHRAEIVYGTKVTNEAWGSGITRSHREKLKELDPEKIVLRLSCEVRQAIADLDVALRASNYLSSDMRTLLHEWAQGRDPLLHEWLVAFPLVAEGATRHINLTGDETAGRAWDSLMSRLLEKGFTLTRSRARDDV